MKEPVGTSPWRVFFLLAAPLALALALVVLYLFDPVQSSLYPVCVFHETTGFLCPGCGSLRAIHQLTHGNIATAFRLNPLLMILLPVAGWLWARELAWQMAGKKWPGLVTRPLFVWVLVVMTVLFGILRNLPVFKIIG